MGRIQTVALALGPPGLALVAFLDSSFLSLPEIADLLVMVMVMQQKNRLLLYAASATAGSMLGCLVLYYLGLRGGSALVRRRLQTARVERTLAAFRRYGVMAVLLPSILPPPTPFKIFVLLAGVAEIGVGRFTTALAIGRGARYLVEGWLAVWYGDQALGFVRTHGTAVSLSVALILALGLIGYAVAHRSPPARP
jgi:membrane protein YqaA with SNARE-associated domain